jgi:hypothetical protein
MRITHALPRARVRASKIRMKFARISSDNSLDGRGRRRLNTPRFRTTL